MPIGTQKIAKRTFNIYIHSYTSIEYLYTRTSIHQVGKFISIGHD